MGWCSGTDVFDSVVANLLTISDENVVVDQITALIVTLQREDWDCEADSGYLTHPLVFKAFQRADPVMAEQIAEMINVEQEASSNLIPSIDDNPEGLHKKYIITKLDGSPAPGEYFVLRLDSEGDPDHVHASTQAIRTYARNIRHTLPKLAEDIEQTFG